ncbi:MAG: ribonuclease P protein component [Lentisphaerae bacterium]|nr:ribonuclease P protein component [Lentisphaerota bacterium]
MIRCNVSATPAGADCRSDIRFRLKKREKLRFKSQFDQIRCDGVKSVAPGMVVVVAPSPENRLECGVICSKKYSLLAVVRNRARRLMWESFRMLKPELSPCRILLIPRRKMKGYKQIQALEELTDILSSQHVLRNPSKNPPPPES